MNAQELKEQYPWFAEYGQAMADATGEPVYFMQTWVDCVGRQLPCMHCLVKHAQAGPHEKASSTFKFSPSAPSQPPVVLPTGG